MNKTYTIAILTMGDVTGYGYRCNRCSKQEIAPGHEDAYFFAARHQRESH